jgi:hypothetical protein
VQRDWFESAQAAQKSGEFASDAAGLVALVQEQLAGLAGGGGGDS